jgi:hypothetical protein
LTLKEVDPGDARVPNDFNTGDSARKEASTLTEVDVGDVRARRALTSSKEDVGVEFTLLRSQPPPQREISPLWGVGNPPTVVGASGSASAEALAGTGQPKPHPTGGHSVVQQSAPTSSTMNPVGFLPSDKEDIHLLHHDIRATHDSQVMLVKQMDLFMRTFDRKFAQRETANEEFQSSIRRQVHSFDDQFQMMNKQLVRLENAQNDLKLAHEQHKKDLTQICPSV